MGCAGRSHDHYSDTSAKTPLCSSELLEKFRKATEFSRQYEDHDSTKWKYYFTQKEERYVSDLEKHQDHYMQLMQDSKEVKESSPCIRFPYSYFLLQDDLNLRLALEKAERELKATSPKLKYAQALSNLYHQTGIVPNRLPRKMPNGTWEYIDLLESDSYNPSTVNQAQDAITIFTEELKKILDLDSSQRTNIHRYIEAYHYRMSVVHSVIASLMAVDASIGNINFFTAYQHYLGDTHGDPRTPAEAKAELCKMLGLDKTAPDSDIRRAYRQKALQLHPDKCGHQPGTPEYLASEAEMKKLNDLIRNAEIPAA